ncbi:MAG: CfrBI family restriction endonuclease [Saprospiraceae bacterium]
MTLTDQVTKNIIKKLITSNDYRIEIVTLINAEFLQFVIEFFKKIAFAKINNENISKDWYKKEMLSLNLSSDEIAINSGLNKKTITNMYNSGIRQVVIDASYEHYDTLYSAIEELTKIEDIDLNLTIKFNKVSVDLNINESLIVINTLAVKRAALRGGLWSTAGKQTEGPLMISLCKLFDVPEKFYSIKPKTKRIKKGTINREVDFYLHKDNNIYKCEVKLMGKGNPESADAVIARDSKVFIADKLSEQNKAQLDSLFVEWVELRDIDGYKKFETILQNLNIPHNRQIDKLDVKLEKILESLFI